MSQFARHARRTPAQIRSLKARNRFVTVWRDRWNRNAANLVGVTATLTLAAAIGAMLGTV